MPSRVSGRPLPISSIKIRPKDLPDKKLFAVSILNKGMVSSVDPADIPEAALSVAKNVRVRYDKTSRRFGRTAFGGTKPDSLKVRRLFDFRPTDFGVYYLRVTNTGVHYSMGSSWVAVTGTLSGGDALPVGIAVVSDNIILCNGNDRLQKIDLEANTVSDLGTIAPRARYVCSFADRVIAAVTGDSIRSAASIYWSGNSNYDEFDAAVDESAGNDELIAASVNTVDPITGLFAYASVMIIPRRGSIWLATKQPIASNPLNFYEASSGVGADIPGAIAMTRRGIIFFNMEEQEVYSYVPGGVPEPIGTPIAKDIYANIDDPATVFSAYDKHNHEYILGVPTGSTTRLWVWNEITQAWAYDEQPNVTAADVVPVLSDYTSIDSLTGTIDALVGTIDSLSVTPIVTPTLVVGDSSGNVLKDDSTAVLDNEVGGGGNTITMEARSKEFTFPKDDIMFNEIRIGYNGIITGTLTLQYSKDGGSTWTTAKTHTIVVANNQQLQWNKLIRGRRIMWRVTSTDGSIDFIEYEVYVYAGGESRD